MKLVCDCGEEVTFETTDENGNENENTPDEGQFASPDSDKFNIVVDYTLVYITCKECDKAIHFLV